MAKRIISMILAALLMMISAAVADGTAHTHAPAEEWERDLQKHWHECECGERFEEEDHVYNDVRCAVCGSEVWEFGDGSGEVYNFDEYDSVIRSTAYNSEGLVERDYRYVLEYSEGLCTREEMYQDGMLVSVTEYAIHKDGYCIPVNQIVYDEEGGRSISENDEYGNCVHTVAYDADDAVIYEDFTEYQYDEEGWILYTKQTGYFDGVLSYQYENNQYGDSVTDLFYAEDGSVEFGTRSEYEYDEDGNKLWRKVYDAVTDRLMQESIYAIEMVDEWPENYEKTFTCYEEDGSKTVYESDVHGNELSETIYNADGKIETVYRSEYEFDENGNVLLHNRYENDRLCLVVQYEIIETEDWACHYEKIRTEIFEDGSMYICEYDEEGNELSAGLFDENGDPIPEEEQDGE